MSLGVSAIQNNARGEAQFLSIRGLNADYNLVQIDGVSLPANEINRRNVSLDVIPSSLASRVEVYKTRTAAMDGNAIGGTANLRTRSAFDGDGTLFIGGRADIGTYDYKQARRKSGPSGQAELVVSDTFGADDKFGFGVSGSYFRRDSASLNSATDNYLYFDPATGARLNQLTQDVSQANAVPDRRRWLHYDNVRERYGVFGKLEFDDHERFKVALTAADFRHINDEERQSNIVILSGTPTNVTPSSGSVAVANGQVDLAEFYQKRRIRYVDGHAELHATDRLIFDGGVNLAVATYRQDARLATYRIANTSNLAYNYTIDPGGFAMFNLANPAYAANAANYRQFEFGTNSDDNREEALTGYGNVAWNSAPEDRGLGLVRDQAALAVVKRRMGRQVLFKSDAPAAAIRATRWLPTAAFQPILNDDPNPVPLPDRIAAYRALSPVGYELVFHDVTFLHQASAGIRAAVARVWVNTMDFDIAAGLIDRKAMTDPDAIWGSLADAGVDAIQTDRPVELIAWLHRDGAKRIVRYRVGDR